MVANPKVFISCGQQTPEEIKLGEDIADLVKDFGYTPFYAQRVSTVKGLTENIFQQLRSCQAFITVMHDRGAVKHSKTGEEKGNRVSVWIEQEIAIAAFMESILDTNLEILAFEQRGVNREGVREFVQLNPIVFDSNDEILQKAKDKIKDWKLHSPDENVPDHMQKWLDDCNTGWLQTIDSKEPNALTTKFTHGYFTLAFQIVDLENNPKVGDLLNNISISTPGLYQPKLWAYPEDYKERPKIILENTLQSYIGGKEKEVARSEFWRARTDGFFFSRNGHIEDVQTNWPPGKVFFLTTPVYVLAFGLKYASRLTKLISSSTHKIKFFASWTGMKNRTLTDHAGLDAFMRFEIHQYTCEMEEIKVEVPAVAAEEIDKNLSPILLKAISKVFEYFNYFLKDNEAEQLVQILGKKSGF